MGPMRMAKRGQLGDRPSSLQRVSALRATPAHGRVSGPGGHHAPPPAQALRSRISACAPPVAQTGWGSCGRRTIPALSRRSVRRPRRQRWSQRHTPHKRPFACLSIAPPLARHLTPPFSIWGSARPTFMRIDCNASAPWRKAIETLYAGLSSDMFKLPPHAII